ncbi:MAG: putative Ig domain-containing protein [Acidobacteriaceae bacterium]
MDSLVLHLARILLFPRSTTDGWRAKRAGLTLSAIALTGLLVFSPPAVAQSTAQTAQITTFPQAMTGLIEATDANFYSVVQGNPDSCYANGTLCGEIVQIVPGFKDANDPRYFTSPANGGTIGNFPGNLLESPEGYLFGTNGYGGPSAGTSGCSENVEGCGTFFEFFFDASIERGSYGYESINVLHNFTYAEGGQGGAITLGSDGNYYGVTVATYRGYYGGPWTIYKLAPDGTFTQLVNFGNLNNQVDGSIPNQLVEGDDGYFYGTTIGENGTVFRIDTSGNLTIIATFPSDGSLGGVPVGQLVEGPDGAFYGVTGAGGGTATVFRVTKSGQITTLHSFSSSDGEIPYSGLLLGSDGVLYGTMAGGGGAYTGGSDSNCALFGGCGTLFSITTTGDNFQILHSFAGGSDGAHPAALIQDSIFAPGAIFGVTGGDGQTASPGGTVFQTTLPAGHQAAPIQIQLFKQSDMSPVTAQTTVDIDTPLILDWQVLNAYSNTMQQCYAHAYVPGDDNLESGEADWTGKQAGTAATTGYSGQAFVTPQKSGTYQYALYCGGVESGKANVDVQATLAISTSSLPDATVGAPYSLTLAATGGTAPYTWSLIAGTLPPGLSYEGPNGIISGTPKQFGTYTFTFQATDNSSTPETATVALTMTVSAGLAVNTATLPQGEIGTPYSQTIAVTGGLTPYTLTIPANSLPAGLSFNAATGTISGTPTAVGTSNFTLSVADAESPQATTTQSYSIKIVSSLLTITAASLPPAGVSQPFSEQFAATGGVGPYTWTVSSGTLPQGLQLTSTGLLSGTPVQYGSGSPFTIQVADTETPPQTATAVFTLPVASTLAITTTALPNATLGVQYSATVSATGGVPPYSWVAGANLPTLGLSIDPNTGIISGIPVVSGSYQGGVGVKDSESTPANETGYVTITIQTTPGGTSSTTLTTSSANAGVGESVTFTATVSVSGGTPTGLVTFADGTNTIGTAMLNASGVATLTTSFPATGVYNVIASYGGDESDQASASTPVTETIVAPSVSAAISPDSITIKPGASGTLAISITPTGGYSGTVNFSCGTLPAHVSCTFTPPSITLTAGGATQTATLTVSTDATQSALLALPFGPHGLGQIDAALALWLPCPLVVMSGIFRKRQRRKSTHWIWLGLLVLGMASVGQLCGCGGGNSNDARPGTYSIPVTLTLSNGAAQTVNATIVVN